jgi:hypothetical protein
VQSAAPVPFGQCIPYPTVLSKPTRPDRIRSADVGIDRSTAERTTNSAASLRCSHHSCIPLPVFAIEMAAVCSSLNLANAERSEYLSEYSCCTPVVSHVVLSYVAVQA